MRNPLLIPAALALLAALTTLSLYRQCTTPPPFGTPLATALHRLAPHTNRPASQFFDYAPPPPENPLTTLTIADPASAATTFSLPPDITHIDIDFPAPQPPGTELTLHLAATSHDALFTLSQTLTRNAQPPSTADALHLSLIGNTIDLPRKPLTLTITPRHALHMPPLATTLRSPHLHLRRVPNAAFTRALIANTDLAPLTAALRAAGRQYDAEPLAARAQESLLTRTDHSLLQALLHADAALLARQSDPARAAEMALALLALHPSGPVITFRKGPHTVYILSTADQTKDPSTYRAHILTFTPTGEEATHATVTHTRPDKTTLHLLAPLTPAPK